MTDQHPITPPPELVDEWRRAPEYTDGLGKLTMVTITVDRLQYIATQAAQYGADQELEACLDEIYKGVGLRIIDHGYRELLCSDLRAARRPKPSLRELALASVKRCAAAVLRADADLVVPEEPLYGGDQRWMFERDARQEFRKKLLAIAAELEANA